MKKLSLLLIMSFVAFLCGCWKDKVDVTETEFEYDVDICDQYFELVECIIDKDNNPNYTKEMRSELKNEIKQMQENWKLLNYDELSQKCMDELNNLKSMEKNYNSFGCYMK